MVENVACDINRFNYREVQDDKTVEDPSDLYSKPHIQMQQTTNRETVASAGAILTEHGVEAKI